MKTMLVVCVLLTALLAAGSGDGWASELRCGLELVNIGDTKSEVLDKCGEPSSIEGWEEERIKRDFYRSTMDEDLEDYERSRIPLFVKEHVSIEEWLYNFGPNKFVRYLRFENGRLKKISTGGYGH